MRLSKLSIKGKLNVIIMATSISVLVLSSTLYIVTDLVKLRRAIMERLVAVAQVVGNNCSAAMVFNDPVAAEEILSGLSAERYIISARICKKNGQQMALYIGSLKAEQQKTESYALNPANCLSTLNIGKKDLIAYAFHDSYLELSQPIIFKGDILGVLQLHYSMNEYKSRMRQYALISVSVLFLSILAAYILSFKLQKVISDPILALVGHMNIISRDKIFTLFKEKESDDEIGALIDGFNEMLRQIKLDQDIIVEKDRRLKHLLTSAPAVIYSASPMSDYGATYVSENVERLFGHTQKQFIEEAQFWLSCIHPDDKNMVLMGLAEIGDRERYMHEYRFRKADGMYVWVQDELIVLRDRDGNPREIIGYMIDVHHRKELENQLIHNALHDGLTGLPNRALFQDRLKSSFIRAQNPRHKYYIFAVFYIDIDRFKNINDSLGHLAGDDLLVAVAKRLQNVSRVGDTVARLGGDEFAMILDSIRSNIRVGEIAQRVCNEMREPFVIEGQKIFISVSVGISMNSLKYEKPEDMQRDADTALYKAKKLGKDRHVFFDDAMHVHAVTVMEIETDLREALRGNELVLHYQPIVMTGTKNLAGFEALIRWVHPRKGMILPALFIPIAEDTGIIEEIGNWVLQQACMDLSRLQSEVRNEPPFTVSVNVSSKQFNENLMNTVSEALKKSGLDPQCLKLEITESVIMNDPSASISLLLRLKAMGVEIYVDDFGTGYSSLSYLQKLPLNALKIDQSFVSMMSKDQGSIEIVRGILGLAKSLGLQVIAEGVEDLSQAATLDMMGCQYIQGFAIAKALDYDTLLKFIKAETRIQQH